MDADPADLLENQVNHADCDDADEAERSSDLQRKMLFGTKAVAVSSNKTLTSKFRGVCWNKKNKRWQAAINSNGKYLYLGSYDSEHQAANIFDKAAVRIRGAKARLNFSLKNYLDEAGAVLPDPMIDDLLAEACNPSKQRRARARSKNDPVSDGPSATGNLNPLLMPLDAMHTHQFAGSALDGVGGLSRLPLPRPAYPGGRYDGDSGGGFMTAMGGGGGGLDFGGSDMMGHVGAVSGGGIASKALARLQNAQRDAAAAAAGGSGGGHDGNLGGLQFGGGGEQFAIGHGGSGGVLRYSRDSGHGGGDQIDNLPGGPHGRFGGPGFGHGNLPNFMDPAGNNGQYDAPGGVPGGNNTGRYGPQHLGGLGHGGMDGAGGYGGRDVRGPNQGHLPITQLHLHGGQRGGLQSALNPGGHGGGFKGGAGGVGPNRYQGGPLPLSAQATHPGMSQADVFAIITSNLPPGSVLDSVTPCHTRDDLLGVLYRLPGNTAQTGAAIWSSIPGNRMRLLGEYSSMTDAKQACLSALQMVSDFCVPDGRPDKPRQNFGSPTLGSNVGVGGGGGRLMPGGAAGQQAGRNGSSLLGLLMPGQGGGGGDGNNTFGGAAAFSGGERGGSGGSELYGGRSGGGFESFDMGGGGSSYERAEAYRGGGGGSGSFGQAEVSLHSGRGLYNSNGGGGGDGPQYTGGRLQYHTAGGSRPGGGVVRPLGLPGSSGAPATQPPPPRGFGHYSGGDEPPHSTGHELQPGPNAELQPVDGPPRPVSHPGVAAKNSSGMAGGLPWLPADHHPDPEDYNASPQRAVGAGGSSLVDRGEATDESAIEQRGGAGSGGGGSGTKDRAGGGSGGDDGAEADATEAGGNKTTGFAALQDLSHINVQEALQLYRNSSCKTEAPA